MLGLLEVSKNEMKNKFRCLKIGDFKSRKTISGQFIGWLGKIQPITV